MNINGEKERQAFSNRLNHALDCCGHPARGRPKLLKSWTKTSDEACRKWLKGMSIPEKPHIKTLAKHVHATSKGNAWVLDRWTGGITSCYGRNCKRVTPN